MGMLDYQPLVLVDTTDLPRDEWLAYRRKGIGGSDAAAVLGISPFMTARDLYYDKLGISAQSDEENWVAKEIGHLLEPLVAMIFEKRTGLKVYQRKVMFQHPQYPWMLADLDYLVEMPDGSRAILECKTTTSNSADNWWYAGKEIVPVYYESQGRHYMAVTNIDRVYFCCLLTDNREAIIDRDNHQAAVEMLLNLVADKSVSPVVITPPQFSRVKQFLQLQEKKALYDAESKKVENEMKRLKAMIVADMGKSCTALYEDAEGSYTITYKPVYKQGISKEALEKLKVLYPQIYGEYVSTSESRRFHVKKLSANAA